MRTYSYVQLLSGNWECIARENNIIRIGRGASKRLSGLAAGRELSYALSSSALGSKPAQVSLVRPDTDWFTWEARWSDWYSKLSKTIKKGGCEEFKAAANKACHEMGIVSPYEHAPWGGFWKNYINICRTKYRQA